MERECYTSLACTTTRENLSKLEWLQMSLRGVVCYWSTDQVRWS